MAGCSAVANIRGRLRRTGEQTGYRSVHVWTIRDGVPIRFAEYVDVRSTSQLATPLQPDLRANKRALRILEGGVRTKAPDRAMR
jgi:hypothetical protein